MPGEEGFTRRPPQGPGRPQLSHRIGEAETTPNPLVMPRLALLIALFLVAPLAPRGDAAPATDPLIETQWGLEVIHASDAWSQSLGKRALVAVIDTGVDLGHPDLRGRVAKGGINLVSKGSPPADDNGHGTHVAGIIAATLGNGEGGAGVAPHSKILPVKACDETGACDERHIANGIRYAADKHADVINISLTVALVRPRLDGRLQMVLDAVEYATRKGAVVVAAGGNLTLPICQEPAASSVCVGATDRDDMRAVYSNGDATMMARYLVAPGGSGVPDITGCDDEIVSTFPVDLQPANCVAGSGYAGMSGTSMAAPFVSGVAALLASQGLSGSQITERLLATSDDLGTPGRDSVFGYGRVNALAAVTRP